MQVGAFDFDLPPDRIALRPAVPRDAARLLVVGDALADRHVRDLPDLLGPGDLLILNDTRVIPAQLRGRRGQARLGLTLHRTLGSARWLAFAKPARRLRAGDAVEIGEGFRAVVEDRLAEGEVLVRLEAEGGDVTAALAAHGQTPLPPYIAARRAADAADRGDYQTVFARRPGAVAAPTAGLHFTPDLFARLDARGIGCVFVTLHVGAATFLPVKTADTADHRPRAEWGEVGEAAVLRIAAARDAGKRIVAVGTTCVRLLEAAADARGTVRPFRGETDLFVVPGFRFRVVDRLLTNFHLPRSSLFMLVAAFAGLERMRRAYAHAIGAGYRFYSYGDACLLDREVM
ncbi:MAG: tRNA preQ1(34) S-adenosylmethionine ribosyltransferase-isomerase QueA [Alphaproteobacteria bacterium]|nr:tRNA preQ1(34) S-adenosylmethionine ribosyltransferase-isomerase QueA [Alphaproteobacteria bacterium]